MRIDIGQKGCQAQGKGGAGVGVANVRHTMPFALMAGVGAGHGETGAGDETFRR
jgi:hypothetical protein